MLLCLLTRIRLPLDEGVPRLHQGTPGYAPHQLVDVVVTCRASRSLRRRRARRGPGLHREAYQSNWVERMFGGQPGVTDGPLNVLVLGVDTRPDSEEMGSRTDTIMLVQVVPKTGDVKL